MRVALILFCLAILCPCSSEAQVVVNNIRIEGNRKTKDDIILRELTFAVGDQLDPTDFEAKRVQSEKNIFNTHLFNRVEVEATGDDANKRILVKVIERWYIWPAVIFELADPNFNLWWETKDLNRINYGVIVNHQNFRGRGENLYFKMKLGYTEELRLTYRKPYINEDQTLGLKLHAQYQQNDEVSFATVDNKRQFFNNVDAVVRRFSRFEAEVIYRPHVFFSASPRITFTSYTINDSLAQIAPWYLGEARNRSDFVRLSSYFRIDKRDVQAYALSGHEFITDVSLRFGWDNGLLAGGITSRFKKYVPLAQRWYWSGSIAARLSAFDRLPYFTNVGLGYDDFVRGYEYYIMDARHYTALKSNFKFALFPQRKIDLGVGPDNFRYTHLAVYLNAYTDFGYANDPYFSDQNSLNNRLLNSYGIGIDIVTYYDKVMRLEVSRNHLGETGLYVHFTQPV